MPRRIDHLVQRRIGEWEAQKRIAAKAGVVGQQPAVAISRTHGARGRAIGHMVAERLGVNAYDKQIVEQIAESAQVRQQLVESVDDTMRDRIGNWVGEQFDTGYFTYSDYLKHLTQVLLTVTRQESAVIVGRGAQYVLDPRRTLRVRVDAPLGLRIERVAEAHGLPPKEARAEVMRVDAQRAAFCSLHFGRDSADADDYDLVLNSGAVPVELCAEVIERIYRSRFG